MQSLVEKRNELLDTIQFPSDMIQCTDCLVPTIADSINSGFICNRVEDPTENNMYVDNNLLVDT